MSNFLKNFLVKTKKSYLSLLWTLLVWSMVFNPLTFAKENTFKTDSPESIKNYIEESIIQENKTSLYNLIIQYKDDTAMLSFINDLIEDQKKEKEVTKKYLEKNMKEQDLATSLKNFSSNSIIIDTWTNEEKANNGFATGWCTWYAAYKTFPFEKEWVQKRLWTWDARQWIANAKNAGYKISKNPKVWDIIVFVGWGVSELWHVGVVTEVRDLTITLEDMNYKGRNVVTRRILLRSSKNIAWYITVA